MKCREYGEAAAERALPIGVKGGACHPARASGHVLREDAFCTAVAEPGGRGAVPTRPQAPG